MLDTRGNTAVYLQFAHARLASILSKARDELHVDLAALTASPELVSVEHEAERALAFELLMFSDVIEVSYEYFYNICIGISAWVEKASAAGALLLLKLAEISLLPIYVYWWLVL